ncbi:hypothetical protein ABDK10_13360 [Staphylococcus aureus]
MGEYFNIETIIIWIIFAMITTIAIYAILLYQRKRNKLNLRKSLIRGYSVVFGIVVFILGLTIPILVDQLTQLINDTKSMGQ